jgi:hypothetical protein
MQYDGGCSARKAVPGRLLRAFNGARDGQSVASTVHIHTVSRTRTVLYCNGSANTPHFIALEYKFSTRVRDRFFRNMASSSAESTSQSFESLEITLDPEGSMEHHYSTQSFWSGREIKDLILFPVGGDCSEGDDVPEHPANALVVPFEEDGVKDSAATYRGAVFCGSQEKETDLHPMFNNSACCRSGQVVYKYQDEIVQIELFRAMEALATELSENDERVSEVTLKLHNHSRKAILALAELQGLPVYLQNNHTLYSAAVSRFFYEADLSVTKIPDPSDAHNTEVEELPRTTRALVTIQRRILCTPDHPPWDEVTETSDTDPAVPA